MKIFIWQGLEPDTEMVSEDELPAEVSKEPLETEAVSDEELPTSGDLPDTEAVSEDELPPEGADKKKKKRKTLPSKVDTGNHVFLFFTLKNVLFLI